MVSSPQAGKLFGNFGVSYSQCHSEPAGEESRIQADIREIQPSFFVQVAQDDTPAECCPNDSRASRAGWTVDKRSGRCFTGPFANQQPESSGD
jgi:hypothetical protein